MNKRSPSSQLQTRPHTTVVLAMTADGKIADAQKNAARFGSARDKLHLEQQIALVDGVLFGAGTLRAYGTTLTITNPELLLARKQQGQPAQPTHIVVSATGKIHSRLKFFSQVIPRWLLTSDLGAKLWQNQDKFERILTFNYLDTSSSEIDWHQVLANLYQLGMKKLAILGGGELVASLFAVDLIDELWLTVCPLILGGTDAPTPVTGIGFHPSQARKLSLLEVKQIDEEVFLHYLVTA